MQEFGRIKSSPENIYLKPNSASSSQSTVCLHPEILAGDVEGQWLQWLMTKNYLLPGKWQAPIFSWQNQTESLILLAKFKKFY